MTKISNDNDFKQALTSVDDTQQRLIAARFVEHVLSLNNDDRIKRAVEVAANAGASQDELSGALKSAKAATIDSHTRCGSEGNWQEQAGYFVSRAAMAALTPAEKTKSGSPAWQAAMSSRMAKTSMLIDDEAGDDIPTHNESEWQYEALNEYLEG